MHSKAPTAFLTDSRVPEGAAWFENVGNDQIYRVDPTSNDVSPLISARMADWQGSIAAGAGSVWAVTTGNKPDSTLMRFDPGNGCPTTKIALPAPGAGPGDRLTDGDTEDHKGEGEEQ